MPRFWGWHKLKEHQRRSFFVKMVKIDLYGRFLTLKLDHDRTLRSESFNFDLKMVKMSFWDHFASFGPFRLRRKGLSFPRKGIFFNLEENFLWKIPGVWISWKFLIFENFSFGPSRSGIHSIGSRVPGVWNFLISWISWKFGFSKGKLNRQRPKKIPLVF